MKARNNGFTMVEIMVVVVLIGLLSALSMPFFNKARKASNHAAFMNDLRVFAGATETLYLSTGNIPVDSNTGNIDPELEEYVHAGFFERETPLGGSWDVEANDSGIVLGVGVAGYTVDDAEIQEIDAKYDDGNITSGQMRKITGSRYYWVIE